MSTCLSLIGRPGGLGICHIGTLLRDFEGINQISPDSENDLSDNFYARQPLNRVAGDDIGYTEG
jgi:hypothetical protein